VTKSNLLLVGTIITVMSGCDARDESQPLFGSASESESSAANNSPVTGAVSANVGGSLSTTSSSSEGALEPQGNNPGSVPGTIVAEITSLDVSVFDSPRGHKIFAGNEIRGVLPGAELDVEYAYFNLDFPCVGDALFESYPSPLMAATSSNMLGGFVWSPLIPSSDTNVWNLDVGAILSGDEEHSILENGIEIYPVNWGDLIVGSAVVNKLVVTRIVQYEECGS